MNIIKVPDERLRKKASEVKVIDKKIVKLVGQMQVTLQKYKEPQGVALAAPQVGKDARIFVIDFNKKKRVIINPEILKITKIRKKGVDTRILEGCLSLPNHYGPLNRANKVQIIYTDLEGKKITEEFRGFFAQIVQHEIDHLNGILFIDRILEQKVPLYKMEKGKWEEVDL